MNQTRRAGPTCTGASLIALTALATLTGGTAHAQAISIAPRTFKPVARVDDRYQSYNVETVEVMGGRFWAPYPKPGVPAAPVDAARSGGVDLAAAMFRKREPIDLANPRLRMLAKAIGPAYVRVSGAWANSTYFHDSDTPPPATPPTGFQGVMTRQQWAGVVAFAKATDAKLVVSFPVSAGTRDAGLVWNPDQARKLIRYTRQLGGHIYAAELINEPNVGPFVGLPKGYTASTFAQDIATLRTLIAAEAPDMKIVGPGSTGEAGFILFPNQPGTLSSEALMSATPRPRFDIFAYHSYGTTSKRCSGMDKSAGVKPEQALDEDWLARADTIFDHYKALQGRHAPGTPVWVTEIAQTACGGDPYAATFLDTFRYVDHLGRLAKRGVSASFHNTLAASDYALIDEDGFTPRPSYWAALLWRRVMGAIVLDAGVTRPGLHVYGQCLPGRKGGVGMAVINLNRTAATSLTLKTAAIRYTLSGDTPEASVVRLNGQPVALTADGRLPQLQGIRSSAGGVTLPPASVTFLAMADANNPACR